MSFADLVEQHEAKTQSPKSFADLVEAHEAQGQEPGLEYKEPGLMAKGINAVKGLFEPPMEGGAGNLAQLIAVPPAKAFLNAGKPAEEAAGTAASWASQKGLPVGISAALGTVGSIAGDPLSYMPTSKGVKSVFNPSAIGETAKDLSPLVRAGISKLAPLGDLAESAKNLVTGTPAVKASQSLPALNKVIQEGIGPEVGATTQAGNSNLLSVLNNVKKTRSALGNNIGQVVAQADTALGPINPKSLQPAIGNAVSNALANSPVVTPQAKAAVAKWFENELPGINSLTDLQAAKTNFSKAIQGHLGKEGDLSQIPLAGIKNALGDVLQSKMPPALADSFASANKAFSQFATLEDGLKASTPGLKSLLGNKTPSIGGSELALDPGKFSKWWNEAVPPEVKSRFEPEFQKALDQLATQPKPNLIERIAAPLAKTRSETPTSKLGIIRTIATALGPKPAFSPALASPALQGTVPFSMPSYTSAFPANSLAEQMFRNRKERK